MKNKHGFTLIELLAVIVVLAIIALIATPIVMNTIKRSKKGAAERSADSYVKQVEVAIASERLNGNILDGEYQITNDGNLCRDKSASCSDDKKIKIEMNGTKPSSGKIKITNGNVDQASSSMIIGAYTVLYNHTKNTYEATEKENGITTTAICELSEGTKEAVGAKYTCHLDSDRTFYVLETSGDNVSLIMDRNFTDDTVAKTLAWCIDGGDDNTTCKNIASKESGTPLKHIQDTFGTSVEVSIPTGQQIATAGGDTAWTDGSYTGTTLSSWLYGNLNSDSVLYGYWTSTPFVSDSHPAWSVYIDGYLGNSFIVGNDGQVGLRPVITLSKSQLG